MPGPGPCCCGCQTTVTVPAGFSTCAAPPRTANLTGITGGGGTIVVVATSSNTALMPNPTVTYTSPATTGTLNLTFAGPGAGTATIYVNVSEAGCTDVTKTITISVNHTIRPPTTDRPLGGNTPPYEMTIAMNSGAFTVPVTGVAVSPDQALGPGDVLSLAGASSNPTLIGNPTITYTSPNATATLHFGGPAPGLTGSATIDLNVIQSNILNAQFLCDFNTSDQLFVIHVV